MSLRVDFHVCCGAEVAICLRYKMDRRLHRMSYTTLKHFIARKPHYGHVEMSFLIFRVVLRDLRHTVAASALTLMALALPRRPLASESLTIEDRNIDVR